MNVTKQLYQWDTGQKLTECTGIYVDYLIGDEVYRVEITDGTCIIPDELLQTSGRYKVWECMADNTLREFAFKVLPRPIPPNYVFTPTEQLTFEGLVQKETNKFNTNAIEKLNAYNANADNRVAEFNAQTEQIQADVSELKSDLDGFLSKNRNKINPNKIRWTNNAIAVEEGVITGTQTRLMAHTSEKIMYFKCTSGFLACAFLYTESGGYIGAYKNHSVSKKELYWQSEEIITSGYIVKIVLRKEDNSNITPSEANDAISLFKLNPEIEEDGYYDLASGIVSPLYYKHGAISTIDGSEYFTEGDKRAVSGFIKCRKGNVIKCTNTEEYDGFYGFLYNLGDKSFTGESTGGYVDEYTVTSDVVYVRVVVRKKDLSSIDLATISNLIKIENGHTHKKYNRVWGNFTDYFTSPNLDVVNGLSETQISFIYDRYNALMTAYPNNITRNLLGYASDVDGNPDTNLPIYEYVFDVNRASKTENVRNGIQTILINSGTHGAEKGSIYGTLKFFEMMFNDENDVLCSIKSNFIFKVIPILNPYGYNNTVRTNARGVDINRNFGYLWDKNTDANKGSSPYSELETQICRDWLSANANALCYIDYHNTGDYTPTISYIATPNTDVQDIYSNVIRKCSEKWIKRYQWADRDGYILGWVTNDKIPCTINEGYFEAGIELSCTLEITWDIGGSKYTKEVLETSTELLANFLCGLIDYCNNN